MFALMPWTRRNALLPRFESPFARFEEFGPLFDRLMTRWPEMEVPEWPNGWALTTEENEKELVVHFELPGFEPAEVKVDLAGDTLTVEAEHTSAAAKPEETTERTCVRRMLTLPPGIDRERVEATYRHGMLDVHIPRVPEEVGRRIEAFPDLASSWNSSDILCWRPRCKRALCQSNPRRSKLGQGSMGAR